MKLLLAIAFLTVVSALPASELPEGTAVKFVDSPINEEVSSDDDGIAVRFVNSVNKEQGDDGIAFRFIDNEEENIADDAGAAVNFVDSPLNEEIPADDSGIAVKFVDSPANEGDIVRVADLPIEADVGTPVKFVDSPINEESSDDSKSISWYPGKIYDDPMLR